MADKYPYNVITLIDADGRKVSISQKKGDKVYCEVWMREQPEPIQNLTVEQLAKFLSKHYVENVR